MVTGEWAVASAALKQAELSYEGAKRVFDRYQRIKQRDGYLSVSEAAEARQAQIEALTKAVAVKELQALEKVKRQLLNEQKSMLDLKESRAYQGPKAPALKPESSRERILEYFASGNSESVTFRLGEPQSGSFLSHNVKQRILSRDGHACVVCGSEDRLIVDHTRATSNGGSNDESNLAVLCNACQKLKTALDQMVGEKRTRLQAQRKSQTSQ